MKRADLLPVNVGCYHLVRLLQTREPRHAAVSFANGSAFRNPKKGATHAEISRWADRWLRYYRLYFTGAK